MRATRTIEWKPFSEKHKHYISAAFAECKEKGAGNGKKSLRRIQFEIAKKGNAAMAIWLGKQWLGQKEPERQETTDNVEDLSALGDMLRVNDDKGDD